MGVNVGVLWREDARRCGTPGRRPRWRHRRPRRPGSSRLVEATSLEASSKLVSAQRASNATHAAARAEPGGGHKAHPLRVALLQRPKVARHLRRVLFFWGRGKGFQLGRPVLPRGAREAAQLERQGHTCSEAACEARAAFRRGVMRWLSSAKFAARRRRPPRCAERSDRRPADRWNRHALSSTRTAALRRRGCCRRRAPAAPPPPSPPRRRCRTAARPRLPPPRALCAFV